MTVNSERKSGHKNVPLNASTSTPKPSATKPDESEYSREELRAISQEVADRFPIPTETTELVLMDVDPHHVHAYWNIKPEDLARYQTNADQPADDPSLILRFHDLSPVLPGGTPRHEPFDIPVRGLENHWHVELWHDARSYVAELGLRLPDGGLASLAQSKPVQMPQAGETQEFPAPEMVPRQVDWRGQPHASALSPDRTILPTTEPALAQVFPNVSANDEQAVRQSPRAGEIPSLPADPSRAGGSPRGTMSHSFPVRIHGPVLTGTSRDPGWATSSSPSMQSGAYSSSSLARSPGFELHAELHIYGQGIPGERLQLFGEPVVLGADGHFSLWRPLEGPTGIGTWLASRPGNRGAQDGDA